MKQRTAFMVAAALTAFVLIVMSGVAASLPSKMVAQAITPAATDAPTDAPTDSPTATATVKPTLPPTGIPVVAQVNPAQLTFLTSAQALKLAMKLAAKSKLTKQPELVNFRGQMAYEVLFDSGSIYIDAFAGKVLYNGVKAVQAHPTVAPSPTDPPTAVPDQSSPPPSDNGGDNGGGGGGGGGGGVQVQVPVPNVAPQVSGPPPSGSHEHDGGKGGKPPKGGKGGGGEPGDD